MPSQIRMQEGRSVVCRRANSGFIKTSIRSSRNSCNILSRSRLVMLIYSIAQVLHSNSSRRGLWRGCEAFCSNDAKRFLRLNQFTIAFHTNQQQQQQHNKNNKYRLFETQINTEKDGRRHEHEHEHISGDYDNDDYTTINEKNWSSYPSLSETFSIPTVLVKDSSVHTIMKELAPHLATRKKEFENIHPRLKAVQDCDVGDNGNGNNDENTISNMKAILLDPVIMDDHIDIEMKDDIIPIIRPDVSREDYVKALTISFPKMDKTTIEMLADASAIPGPIISKTIPYTQQPIQRILSKILPKEAQPPPTGFEQIGHVIHLNLKEKHYAHRKLIGSVILDRLSPKIKTVVNKVGEVSGPYRTYDMEILAGKSDLTVEVVEDSVSLHFDLRKVYWCTRLSGERSRMLKDEFKEGQIIADAFCGVGALCVLAASKLGCTIYANDLNPDAVKYLQESAKKNRRHQIKGADDMNDDSDSDNNMSPKMPPIDVHCGDAFDFIQNLGSLPRLPHHVVMNYPLDSASFLGAFRWWPASKTKINDSPTVVHLYTFARGDDPKSEYGQKIENPRSASDVAIDLVADGLVPEGGAIQVSRYRKDYLNELGCDVKALEVRDVAPGKVVICVSFKVTNLLLSVMQGDFIDTE
jgi:tRNA G37 N-methylase Trm5